MLINFPVKDRKTLTDLKAGAEVLLSGTIYSARDSVHSLTFNRKSKWPFNLKNNAIFYTGPTIKKEGFPFGSCGPTTSARMDRYTPKLYDRGLAATIGKGPRSKEVVDSIKKNKGVYFTAYGGCGALYGSKIVKAGVVGYKELGPEAVYEIKIKNFPVIVGIDSKGESIYNV